MKLMIAIFSFIISAYSTQALTINDARNAYELSIYKKSIGTKFLQEVENVSSINNVLLGYKGAVKMIMAKHYFYPWQKLNSFNEGKNILENAIAKDENNIELIYLRFSIQSHSPQFLNYSNNISNDKIFLLKSISSIKDKDLQLRIINYLKSSPFLSQTEKNKLNSIS
jgi:hypothetical protein